MVTSSREHTIAQLREQLAARSDAHGAAGRRPSGFAALDEALGGGFFEGALNEVLLTHPGSGILEALETLLRPQAREPGGPSRFAAWVHPQDIPYPPAMAALGLSLDHWLFVRPADRGDQLWALEQILRSGLCETLVTRLEARENGRTLRRLAIAAREGQCLTILLRPAAAAQESSPAPLRLLARPSLSHFSSRRAATLEVLKCESRPFSPPFQLEWSVDALDLTQQAQVHRPQARPLKGVS